MTATAASSTRLPKLTEGRALTKTVPLDDRTSLYSAWGDWLGLSCLAVTIGLLPLALAGTSWPGSGHEGE